MASNASNLVDASGYKFSDKDTKPGKIKLKKQASTGKGAKTGGKADQGTPPESYSSFNCAFLYTDILIKKKKQTSPDPPMTPLPFSPKWI